MFLNLSFPLHDTLLMKILVNISYNLKNLFEMNLSGCCVYCWTLYERHQTSKSHGSEAEE